ncbi:glycosyltransferase family protein [Caldisalinibacter kiritimatiensis]|uniref:Glycosyltransferase n=1 Tax=Caldisalinibacter kiritimatiensis TaxID=1304284 RepID=R1ATL4_9FIRM|nr:glycosyltransferase [Caldisalinibacter kiritimatiensis]EOC99966.1 glycosyltransferase [Caldisalinibacter kiritimatiensis]
MREKDVKINITKAKSVKKIPINSKSLYKPKVNNIPKRPVNKCIDALIKKNMERNYKRWKKNDTHFINTSDINIESENNMNIKVACIMDEFYYHWFKYDCNLIPLPINNWQEVISKEKPDILLVQSAWRGNNGQWANKVVFVNNTNNKHLNSLIKYCNSYNIPTVFWNTEDPLFFKEFIEAAKLFDFIFATDLNSIPRYKEIVKHENIYLLPFAIQPRIHNPINKDKNKIGNVVFAGTWYNNQPSRIKDMEIILKPAIKYGLDIYDRGYNIDDSFFEYPDIYKPCIKPALPYLEMIEKYKKYNLALNVNFISDSPTMFSQRIFELLGCGINIVSSYNSGIEKFFPNVVKLSTSEQETKYHLNTLLNNKDLRDKLALQGLREVYSKHTVRHRLETICNKLGIKYVQKNKPGVSIITSTMRDHFMDNVFENYAMQTYDKKELIVILNKNSMDINKWKEKAKNYPNVKIYQVDESKTIGYCLNYGIDRSQYKYIAKFDDDNYYGPNYLSDIVMAFDYSGADLVGKQRFYVYFEGSKKLALIRNKENSFVKYVAGSTFVFKREVYEKIRFATNIYDGSEDNKFIDDCNKYGFKIYSCDRFNHVVGRRENLEDHTWKIKERDFLSWCKVIAVTDDYKKYVTV